MKDMIALALHQEMQTRRPRCAARRRQAIRVGAGRSGGMRVGRATAQLQCNARLVRSIAHGNERLFVTRLIPPALLKTISPRANPFNWCDSRRLILIHLNAGIRAETETAFFLWSQISPLRCPSLPASRFPVRHAGVGQ